MNYIYSSCCGLLSVSITVLTLLQTSPAVLHRPPGVSRLSLHPHRIPPSPPSQCPNRPLQPLSTAPLHHSLAALKTWRMTLTLMTLLCSRWRTLLHKRHRVNSHTNIKGYRPEWCISSMISRVPNHNGVSQAWYTVEIHHSDWKPSIYSGDTPFWSDALDMQHGVMLNMLLRKNCWPAYLQGLVYTDLFWGGGGGGGGSKYSFP